MQCFTCVVYFLEPFEMGFGIIRKTTNQYRVWPHAA